MFLIIRYWFTLKHLKACQIYYKLFYSFKKGLFLICTHKLVSESISKKPFLNKIKFSFLPTASIYRHPAVFTFLNQPHDFIDGIDWNYHGYGKLWTYNLNYFDYLLQPDIRKENGIRLIHQFINDLPKIKDGLEPYPVSLRIMNWVKFCLQNKINDECIDRAIHGHIKYLSKNLEYHLMANHLLENTFALCIGSLYTGDEKLYLKGQRLLNKELKEQILPDGAHFECSPMYHQIILGRLLDLIQIADASLLEKQEVKLLQTAAGRMLGWIKQVSFENIHLPLFNDAAVGIAPDTDQLFKYAKQLNIEEIQLPLKECGYRKFTGKNWEMLADVGDISPSYQPGHAHAGTFSFELYYKGNPFIVDTGTSTYEPGERRSFERSTMAHNTVVLFDSDSSEVWASHRVGRRAKVVLTEDMPNIISAWHNGYKQKGAIHRRSLYRYPDSIEITDNITWRKNQKNKTAWAYLHFSPDIGFHIKGNELYATNKVMIKFSGNVNTEIFEYKFAPEFNKLIPALAVKIEFIEQLKTIINFETPFSN